jgi:hypothetical protein
MKHVVWLTCILLLTAHAPSWADTWQVRTLTSGPKQHFFGYYGISPWNASGSRMICLEVDSQERMPQPGEKAAICLLDPQSGETTPIAETGAWNLQQGAMMHWDPRSPENRILFNDRDGDSIHAVAFNVDSGERRVYPRAVSAVSPDGRWALSLTYGRLGRMRRVVGYPGILDPNPESVAPDNDGVFLMDLETGAVKLVVSHAEIYARLLKDNPALDGTHIWFNHTLFNRDTSRFFFLARANIQGVGRKTAMFVANRDGGDLWQAIPFDGETSHFDWRNTKEIIATYKLNNPKKDHVLITDRVGNPRILAPDFLNRDGHCTFGPEGAWLASDPRAANGDDRRLMLYNLETDERITIGAFPLGPYAHGDLRCDLHPRWKNTGDAICFDAIAADGTRQVHLAERK